MCCDLLRIYYFCTINHSNKLCVPDSPLVVICFEFIIFALSITAYYLNYLNMEKLWFASNLLFLHYQSQHIWWNSRLRICCDLLRIYYFCTINHSLETRLFYHQEVVICFEFIIFALSITARPLTYCVRGTLWFASNLLFLHYQSQPYCSKYVGKGCCDLLRIYYFCTINHSEKANQDNIQMVVICFEFIIFALSITALPTACIPLPTLWFASNLLFLHYQSQQKQESKSSTMCCDLLRIYYFCTINHSFMTDDLLSLDVVICFEFIIFALSITAVSNRGIWDKTLWFASNLLFLHYQSQRKFRGYRVSRGCDLLRIYYFCTINHSWISCAITSIHVVICFEFIIFALSITAWLTHRFYCSMLWFASNLLFLHYQSQRW